MLVQISGACEDGMFDVADGKYSCNMLIDRHHPHQHILGAYDIRDTVCSRPNFGGCCKTCLENNILVNLFLIFSFTLGLLPARWHSANTYLSSLGILGTEPAYYPNQQPLL